MAVSKPLLNRASILPNATRSNTVTIVKNFCLIALPLLILANFLYWSPKTGRFQIGTIDRPDSAKVQEKIIYPWRKDCTSTYTFNFTSTWGLASEVNHLFFAAMYARWANRTLQIDGERWNYGNYYDLFENVMPDCGITGELPNSTHDPTADAVHPHVQTIRYWDGLWQWLHDRSAELLSFAYLRDTARTLFKPSKKIQEIADHYKSTIQPFEGKYWSIHARRGDKVYEGAKIYDMEDYFTRIELLIKRFEGRDVTKDTPGITVFIASDELEAAVSLAKERRPKWNIIHIATNHTHGGGHMQWTFNHLSLDKKMKEVGHLVAELQMIQNAEGCVCTYSSNVCTFIQMVRHGHPRSVQSLDRQMYSWLKIPEIHQDPINIGQREQD